MHDLPPGCVSPAVPEPSGGKHDGSGDESLADPAFNALGPTRPRRPSPFPCRVCPAGLVCINSPKYFVKFWTAPPPLFIGRGGGKQLRLGEGEQAVTLGEHMPAGHRSPAVDSAVYSPCPSSLCPSPPPTVCVCIHIHSRTASPLALPWTTWACWEDCERVWTRALASGAVALGVVQARVEGAGPALGRG